MHTHSHADTLTCTHTHRHTHTHADTHTDNAGASFLKIHSKKTGTPQTTAGWREKNFPNVHFKNWSAFAIPNYSAT